MEFDGEVISLGNTDVKIKNLLRNVNARENDIKALMSRIEELEGLLQTANERISKLLGSLVDEGRKRHKKPKRGKIQVRKNFVPPVETYPSPVRAASNGR